jgi:GT2 family glycosyltransferase
VSPPRGPRRGCLPRRGESRALRDRGGVPRGRRAGRAAAGDALTRPAAKDADAARAPAPAPAGTAAPIDVSVIVVSWNTRDALRECLASVVRQTRGVAHELLVVDNASADGSAEMVRAEFPSVTLIANAENRGFAAANNQALRLARGRHVLLLNPDTVVVDDAISASVRLADADPTVGALGCQVLLREGEVQRTCFRFPSVAGLLRTWWGLEEVLPPAVFGGGPTMRDWDRRSARDVDVVSGMFLLVRREALDRVGPMDEGFFVYAEEADWCFRLRRAGWRCTFTPAARIVHRDGGGKSTAQVRVRMYVQLQKSILLFHRKHFGPLSWAAAKAVYVAAMAFRWAVWTPAAVTLRTDAARQRARCASAALRFHLLGVEPSR